MKNYLPLAVLMLLHAVFLLLDVYAILHVDSAMHLAGGVALAIGVYGLLACAVRKGWCPDPGTVITPLLVVAMVTSGAVCWEFYEWLSDYLFGTQLQRTVTDTVKDLFLGMLGGALYAGYRLSVNAGAGESIVAGNRCDPVRSES